MPVYWLVCVLLSIVQDPVITCMAVSPQANRVLVGGRTVDSFEVSTSRRGGVERLRSGHGEGGGMGAGLLVPGGHGHVAAAVHAVNVRTKRGIFCFLPAHVRPSHDNEMDFSRSKYTMLDIIGLHHLLDCLSHTPVHMATATAIAGSSRRMRRSDGRHGGVDGQLQRHQPHFCHRLRCAAIG